VSITPKRESRLAPKVYRSDRVQPALQKRAEATTSADSFAVALILPAAVGATWVWAVV
jgi:hypothetical protein